MIVNKATRQVLLTGCIMSVAASGCSMMDRFMDKSDKPETYVAVWLDGMKAEMGDVYCSVGGSVSTGPTVRYEITDDDKIGRVSTVIINIFREFGDGWSSNADFVVTAKDINNPDAQLKQMVNYNLGDPGSDVQIIDRSNQTVGAVTLDPGTRYLMNFVVSADRSETVQVEFKTR